MMAAANAASRRTFTPPKTYTFKQIEELWVGAGGALAEAPLAASIALAESGGNPGAEGHNTNGSIDRGLFQINSVHGALSTTNLAANVKAAVKIHKESGWSPWVTYKTGAYKKYYQSASIPLEKGAEGLGFLSQEIEAGLALFGATGGAGAEVGSRLATGKSLASTVGADARAAEVPAEKALESLGPPSWVKLLVTGVLLLAGAVLVVYGIMVAVRPRESAFSLPKMPVPVPV